MKSPGSAAWLVLPGWLCPFRPFVPGSLYNPTTYPWLAAFGFLRSCSGSPITYSPGQSQKQLRQSQHDMTQKVERTLDFRKRTATNIPSLEMLPALYEEGLHNFKS